MNDYGVGSWPRRRARIRPDAVALRQGEQGLTYADSADAVENLARTLAERGIRHGDRVAYLGRNHISAFVVFFATTHLGAIFVPLNTRLTDAELAALLHDSAPDLLFHDAEHRWLADLCAHGIPLAAIEDIPLSGGGPAIGEPAPVGLDDPAVILYTSGTTGRPKGAVLTHGNLTFNTVNQLAHVDVLGSDTALCIAPLFHATGLGLVSLPTLFKGGTVEVIDRFEPAAVLTAIAERAVTSFSAVPTMLQMLCDHPDFEHTELSSLRYVIYGGSPVSERVAQVWQHRGVDILLGYGMTEASPGVCLATPEGAPERPLSAGPPHFFTDVAIAGATDSGHSGEVLIRGPHLASRYWNDTADMPLTNDGRWFRSGDLARFDDAGWIHIIGRIKDMFISGGENVYPDEIEARINALPGIVECAVVGVADERWGEVGAAYVVTTDHSTIDAADLRTALRSVLAGYKVPHHMRFVAELPKNATGKVLKHLLPGLASTPSDQEIHP